MAVDDRLWGALCVIGCVTSCQPEAFWSVLYLVVVVVDTTLSDLVVWECSDG